MPLVEPLLLFDLPDYKRFGNLFWPDRLCLANTTRTNPFRLYAWLGLPVSLDDTRATDAGQLLFNR